MKQPKFTFGQTVKVTRGFFRGIEGVCTEYEPAWVVSHMFSEDHRPAVYYVTFGNRQERFTEDQLEEVSK